MRKAPLVSLVTFTFFAFGLGTCFALGQSNDNQASSSSSATAASPVVIPEDNSLRPFSAVAAGVTLGSQVIGIEAATPLPGRFNLRGGANLFSYSTGNISVNNNTYSGGIDLRTIEAGVDWFPFGDHYWSFHLSPGLMFYNGTKVTASILPNASANTSVSLNGDTYYSDPSDPLGLSGKISFPTVAPEFTVGFGDMLPRRRGKRFSAHTDLGFAYFGSGTTSISATGSECVETYSETSSPVTTCQKASADTTFQADLAVKRAAIEKNVTTYARFYPILSEGFSWKF